MDNYDQFYDYHSSKDSKPLLPYHLPLMCCSPAGKASSPEAESRAPHDHPHWKCALCGVAAARGGWAVGVCQGKSLVHPQTSHGFLPWQRHLEPQCTSPTQMGQNTHHLSLPLGSIVLEITSFKNPSCLHTSLLCFKIFSSWKIKKSRKISEMEQSDWQKT